MNEQGPRSARKDELSQVEALANKVFRSVQDQPQTMFQEYADLYHTDNIDNIRIITCDDKVVANINYLPQELSLLGTRIKMTTLGGVCTHPDHRGRGFASALLADCIGRIDALGADLLHISGEKPIYINAGSVHAGVIHKFSADAAACASMRDPSLTVSEYSPADLNEVARLYQTESVRFVRSLDRLKLLLDSKKFVHAGNITRRNLLIRRHGKLVAYAIMTFKGSMSTVNEYAGGMETLFAAASAITERYGSASFRGYIMGHEAGAIALCRRTGVDLLPKRLPGTIRIMDFKRFMTALMPYFRELYNGAFVDALRFESDEAGFHFISGDTRVTLPDRCALNDLIFGTYEETTADYGAFGDFFGAVFPMPFVYTENLSYS